MIGKKLETYDSHMNDGETTEKVALRTGPESGAHGFLRVDRPRKSTDGRNALTKEIIPIAVGRQSVGVVASGGRVGHGERQGRDREKGTQCRSD